MRYQITQLTRDRKPGDGGRWNGYYYTVLGTLGETDEFPCKTNRSRGANSTCSNDIEDSSDIGVYTGLRIRNDCDNTWVAEKIYMEIDGEFSFGDFYFQIFSQALVKSVLRFICSHL